MKYLRKFNESVDFFDFSYDSTSKDGNSTYYVFNDGPNVFRLEIKRLDDTDVELFRYVYDNGDWTYKVVKVSSLDKLYNTIYTHILPDYVSKNEWVELVVINGLGKDLEKDFITQRTKMNMRYIPSRVMNGWKYDRDGNEIYLYKNK